jgi:hypothetical protein
VTVVDGTVHLLIRDTNGVLQASIDTDDPVVRDWARERFDGYWAEASALDADDLG